MTRTLYISENERNQIILSENSEIIQVFSKNWFMDLKDTKNWLIKGYGRPLIVKEFD